MSIAFRCPSCGVPYQAKDDHAGRKTKCRKCGGELTVPQADVPEAAADLVPPATDRAMTSATRCPACSAELAAGAVLCIQCGYHLTLGRRVAAASPPAAADARGATRKPRQPRRARPIIVLLAVVIVSSLLIVWGVTRVIGKWRQMAAHARIAEILEAKQPSAREFAEQLPYLPSYWAGLTAGKGGAEAKQQAIVEVIPRLPVETDISPLLLLPHDSIARPAVLALAAGRNDRHWRIEKSCHPDANVRAYGADLLAAALPSVTLDDGTKSDLAKPISTEEKRRLYEPLVARSQAAAEQQLPGRYRVVIEGTWAENTVSFRGKDIGWTPISLGTPAPTIEVACREGAWNVRFGDQQWSGPVDQLGTMRLACPGAAAGLVRRGEAIAELVKKYDALRSAVREKAGAEVILYAPELDAFRLLLSSTLMLRFDGGRFVLETEPLPRRFQIVQGGRGGISGFGDFRPAVVREGVAAGAQGK